jgi:hypothetical protein
MPLTGLVFLVLGGVYAVLYERSTAEAKRSEVNTKVAAYGRILFPAAGVILLAVWAVREIF